MKVFNKALVVAALCISMAVGVTGCGSKALDGSQVVATVGEKEMTLGEANFLLRYQQVQTESYYEGLFGDGIYEMDLYGDGTDFATGFKADVMEQMQEYYILEEKAAEYGVALTEEETKAIAEVAETFLADNESYTAEQMTADQATVERVLELMTIRSKVAQAIYAAADVTVTDDEAAQRGFRYIAIYKGTDEEAMTEEDIEEARTKLAAAIESVKSGNSIDAAAVEQGLTAYSGNYGLSNESYYDEILITAMKELSEGEVSEVLENDSALYVTQVTEELDEEATENSRNSLLKTKQTEAMNVLMDTWKSELPLTINEAVWEQVVFDRSYDIKPEE